MKGVWIHCTFSLIVKYYPWFWFLLALNSRCYHLQKMAQINVSWDGIPKTLLEEQCAAVLNSRISHQLTWLLGLNIFLSITAVLGKYSDLSRSWSGNFTTCTVQTSVTLPIDNWSFGRALVRAYVCCLRNEFVKWKFGNVPPYFCYQFHSRLYLKWSIFVYIDSDKLG